ncbi:pulmonary surfactant-associated protein B [Cuculus canorus]|uniref:pulmonary surfactant-associated protein B n=1 Tax=Cuculus canorus TaxID=55661 RepID=UPI0023AAD73B|nr:pulmonary surfactant-associated protein B [Cuculus canorus]
MAASPAIAPLLLALLCAPGLGVPRGGCEGPPDVLCRSWETALQCGGLCAPPATAPPATDMCSDCQQIITLLTHMVNASATKVAVEGFLRHECEELSVPTLVKPCQNLVHEYFNLLLADLEGHLKPSAICAHLELCPRKPGGDPALSPLTALGAHLQVAANKTLPVPLPRCWLCRTFLARLEAAVPKATVATAAAELCRLLPAVVAGACQCLAQRYATLALEGLLGRLGPRLLCHLLLSCRQGDALGDVTAEGTEDVPLLSPNATPCALGPLYWCSSPAAARRCRALQHCRDHVWN